MAEGLASTEREHEPAGGRGRVSRATFSVYYEDKGRLAQEPAQDVFDELADTPRCGGTWPTPALARTPAPPCALWSTPTGGTGCRSWPWPRSPPTTAACRRCTPGCTTATPSLIEIIERGRADGVVIPDRPARATTSAGFRRDAGEV